MSLRRTLAAVALAATLAPLAIADTPASPLDSLPPDVRRIVDEALAKQGQAIEAFSVTFEGGTVTQYLDAIRKAHPKANIIGAVGLDAYTVPSITLKGVTTKGALRPLEFVAQDAHGRIADLSVRMDDGVASVWLDTRESQAIFQDGETEALEAFVWNSKTLTADGLVSVADITGAIETALSVFPGAKPEVRIHEATGILAIRGTVVQLDTVREVIDQLGQMPDAMKRAKAAIRHEQEQIDEMQQQVRAVELQIAGMEERRKTLETGLESDDIDTELSRLRMMLDEGRARLQAAIETFETTKARAQSAGR